MGYPIANVISKMLSPCVLKKFTSDVNALVLSLQEILPFESLGPTYGLNPDSREVNRWLQSYRLHKKFCVPDSSKDLAAISVAEVLEYDSNGLKSFVPATMSLDPSVRRSLYLLRNKLHENFSNFRFDFHDVVLPTGETVIGKQGDCSIYSKLADAKQWCSTPDCFDIAAGIVYRTSWLKRIAKTHMPVYSRCDNVRLYEAFGGDGFEIFKCKLLDFVTIVPGSRITTVPKNNDRDRVINMEPLLNMVSQLTFSQCVRKILKDKCAYDMEHAQEIHRKMISNLDYATIDLSKASDSNWMSVIEFLFPKRFVRFLKRMRSPIGNFRGTEHVFNMLSPMGNGFTFEVMTTTLLHLCRLHDPDSSVFGDDIIVKADVAPHIIECLKCLGYKTNVSKTFIDGLFRESCGGFYHKDQYLLSYDFWYCDNPVDACITVNKLLAIMHILEIEEVVLSFIRSSVPLLLLREGPLTLAGYISVPRTILNVKRLKRRDSQWTRMTPKFIKSSAKELLDYQYDHRKVDFYLELRLKSHTYITRRKFRKLPLDNVRNKALIGSYLYSGMCTAPTLRNANYVEWSGLIVY